MTIARSVLFESFNNVPVVWDGICQDDDLAMDLRVLYAFERTLKEQCRCWGLIIYNASGIAMGCAALCSFQVNWMGVLFCGLPVPSGATHLRIKKGACAKSVLIEVDRAMRRLAESLKIRLIVFKEFDDAEASSTAILSDMGYIRGAIPPMHLLHGSFASFADYSQALKSRYRAQIERSQRKLRTAGFIVICGRGHDFFAQHFNDSVHALYVAVRNRAKHKLELMPASFFHELAAALDQEVVLTLIYREGRACAFTFSIARRTTHYNLYSGLDYTLNNEGDLYFNLFYSDMDQAFKSGAHSLHLGQTSDAFKSRLGTHTQPLYFFSRAPSFAFNLILRLAAPFAFPKVIPVAPHHVFTRG